MELREFTHVDWYGLAGCEPWIEGREPMVAYGVPVGYWPRELPHGLTVIVDAQGIALLEEDNHLHLEQPDRDTAVGIAELLLSKPINYLVLLALGFTDPLVSEKRREA